MAENILALLKTLDEGNRSVLEVALCNHGVNVGATIGSQNDIFWSALVAAGYAEDIDVTPEMLAQVTSQGTTLKIFMMIEDARPTVAALMRDAGMDTKNIDIIHGLEVGVHARDPEAQRVLGMLYFMGQGGVAKADMVAFHLLNQSAEQGHVAAMENLGDILSMGEGVAHDASLAAEWYMRAGHLGSRRGMCRMADLFYRGEGVPQDKTQAYMWLVMAAEAGVDVVQNLQILATLMTEAEIDAAEKLLSATKVKH